MCRGTLGVSGWLLQLDSGGDMMRNLDATRVGSAREVVATPPHHPTTPAAPPHRSPHRPAAPPPP